MSEDKYDTIRYVLFTVYSGSGETNPTITSTIAMIQTRAPSSWLVCVRTLCWQLGQLVCIGSGGNMDVVPDIPIAGAVTTTVVAAAGGAAW